MRSRHIATLAALTAAGLTAAAALHRRAERRPLADPTTPAETLAPVGPAPVSDGVVVAFVRPVGTPPAAAQPTAPSRCGESGGRTRAGTPCAARATSAGRCHHHPLAA